MTTTITACPLDCPDTCSIAVEVDGAGRIAAVDAAPGNPMTQGFICHKVKHHARRVYAPERVLTPLVRTGAKGEGRFRPAPWDEALELVSARLRDALDEWGPASILPYVYNSSAGDLASAALTPLLFDRLRVPEVEDTICAATAGQAWEDTFGNMLSADPLDLPASCLIVLWGANPTASNTHLLPLLTEAKAAGATVVAVDPRRTGAAARADLHLAVRPGTDVVLAYALARLLAERGGLAETFLLEHAVGTEAFLAAADAWGVERSSEVCGVPAAQIEELAGLIASRRPGILRVGWGLERNRNGGSSYRAVLALWVLAGQFGERGSGILSSCGAAAPLSVRAIATSPRPEPAAGSVNMNRVGAVLCGREPGAASARVLFVQGANPAVTAPDQQAMLEGLAREDLFTVVHDQVMTDTARFADVVLPATTHFEAADVAHSYGTYAIQAVVPAIARVGESRTNDELAAGLAVRLGLDPEEFDPDPARLLARMVTDGDITGPRVLRPPGGTVQFVDTFPTFDDGRARLHTPDGELPVPTYQSLESDYPLTMLSPASAKTINSMFGEFDPPAAVVALNPDDAAERGIVADAMVRVWNDLGSLVVPCRIDATLRSGVCALPKGMWLRGALAGGTVNSLVPATLSDLAGGACFNDARVEVRREG